MATSACLVIAKAFEMTADACLGTVGVKLRLKVLLEGAVLKYLFSALLSSVPLASCLDMRRFTLVMYIYVYI